MKRGILSKLSMAGLLALGYTGARAAPIVGHGKAPAPVRSPRSANAVLGTCNGVGTADMLSQLIGSFKIDDAASGYIRSLTLSGQTDAVTGLPLVRFALVASTSADDPLDENGQRIGHDEQNADGSARVRQGRACLSDDSNTLVLQEDGYDWAARFAIIARNDDDLQVSTIWDQPDKVSPTVPAQVVDADSSGMRVDKNGKRILSRDNCDPSNGRLQLPDCDPANPDLACFKGCPVSAFDGDLNVTQGSTATDVEVARYDGVSGVRGEATAGVPMILHRQ
jgi:hypothetical protein